jgi:hypothetical protein
VRFVSRFCVLILIFAALVACSNPAGGGGGDSSAKAITGFTIEDLILQEEDIAIDPETKTITVTVPQGTDLTGLTPEIQVSPGAGIDPASGELQEFFTADGYSPVVYTVTGTNGSEALWTVTVKWEPLEADAATIADVIEDYFADLPAHAGAGSTADDPIILPLRLSLAAPGWANLLAAIQSKGKYVALDLSECDISGMTATEGEFDPQPGPGDAGESKIVSLILPDEAASVKSTFNNRAFKHFSALKSVTVVAVTSVGSYAFYHCEALTTVSFPAVQTIGSFTFADCAALKTVNLPAAQTIDSCAFDSCTSLETISLPAATTIGNYTFADCTALKTVSLPAAPRIDSFTFVGCTALKTVSLPAATYIGYNAFTSCTALETVNLPAAIHIVTIAFNGCTALKTVSLPAATHIDTEAFQGCTALETMSLPAVQTIDQYAFEATGMKPLALTLGVAPPTLGTRLFYNVTSPKTVTVKVPDNAAWNAIISAYNGTNTTNNTWGNAFRGGGWDGESYLDGEVNPNINLTIQAE